MVRIGKHSSNDIVVKDHLSEEFHCLIYFEDGVLHLCDQNTRFGTLVNGQKEKLTALKQGDIVQIGFSKIDWESKCFIAQSAGYIAQSIDANSESEFEKSTEVNEEFIPAEINLQLGSDSIIPERYRLDAKQTLINEWNNNLLARELDYEARPIQTPNAVKVLEVQELQKIHTPVIESDLMLTGDISSNRILIPENTKAKIIHKSSRIPQFIALVLIVFGMAGLGWLAAYLEQH